MSDILQGDVLVILRKLDKFLVLCKSLIASVIAHCLLRDHTLMPVRSCDIAPVIRTVMIFPTSSSSSIITTPSISGASR